MTRELAAMGRGGDDQVGHLTTGEVVVPRKLAESSDLRADLMRAFAKAGVPIGRYTVGGMDDSRNPKTGMREYYGAGEGLAGFGGDPGGAPDAGASVDPGGSGFGGDVSSGTSGGGDPVGQSIAWEGERFTGTGTPVGRIDDRGFHSFRDEEGNPRSWADVAGRNPSAPLGFFGLLSSMFNRANRYSPMARDYNEFARAEGRPHHDPETGIWTVPDRGQGVLGALGEGLNPRNWHPGPVPHSSGYDPRTGADPSDGTSGASTTAHRYLPADGGAGTGAGEAAEPARGFYTPPAEGTGPSWRKYLDVA